MIFSGFYKLVLMLFLSEKSQKVFSLLLEIAFPPAVVLQKETMIISACVIDQFCCRQIIIDGLLHLEHVMINRAVISETFVLVVDARGANRS